MSLNHIGQNAAEEFFETILFNTAYTEAQDQVRGFTKDIESDVMQDAVSSSMTMLTTGLIFLLMRTQEQYIERIFAVAKTITMALIGSEFFTKFKNRLGNFKGIKLLKRMSFFKSSFSDRIALTQTVTGMAQSHFQAEKTNQNETSMISHVNSQKDHIVNKEKLHHDVGNSMASRYNETLLFKLFTKSFTNNDETIIKKILGRDTASALSIDDMNQVADFMFVTDNNGNVSGLSEQMYQLINGLGYVHNT